MRKLLEAMTKFANPEQKPGEQWKGTDKGTPGNKLVGSADESVLKDLSKGQTPKTKEQELAEEWANFNEDDLGVEEKRPHRTGSRADKVGVRGHKEQPRYTTVKDEVDEATAAGLKVGDHITANTSKGEYPGGHKSRAGKVTRVGQTGVHIRPDDGGEVEYHPYKIVKKTVKDKDVYETTEAEYDRNEMFRKHDAETDDLGVVGMGGEFSAIAKAKKAKLAKQKELAEDSLDNEYEGGESDNDYFDRQKPKKLSKRSQQRDNAADARKIGSFSVDGKVVRSNVNGLDHKQVAKELSNKYPGKNIEWNMTSKPFNEGWNNGSDRVHLSDSTSAYWGGTGRLQAEYDELYKQLVPASGAAETLEGEVIRASSKIVYRHFNDGDEFNKASFDQLKPFIGSVTSYDDLAEKAIEFALKAQGNYHPNAGWDSLDVMDYGPSEEEEYDDEDDENDYQDWEDPNEDNLEEADMFKAGQRAIKNIKSTEQQRKSEANKMAQAQAQIDADKENERDRFSQEELYPADDSHDLDEAMNDEGWDEKHRQETLPGMDTPYQSVAHQTLNQAAKVKPLTRTTTGNIVVNSSVTPQANGDLLVKGTTTDASVTPNRKNVWVLTINANQQIKNKHVSRLNDAELEAVVFNLGTNGILRNKQVNPLKENDPSVKKYTGEQLDKLVAHLAQNMGMSHAQIRKQYVEPMLKDGRIELVDSDDVEEGWEADLAKTNRERMKKERAAATPAKPLAKAIPNYDRVFQDINSAIGDTFPDGDPIDALMRKYRDSYGDLNIDLLNKACRVNGAKSYNDYVAKVWQQHMDDNPDLVQGGNPWVAEGWESGPDEPRTQERDPDEYKARRQEKLDAEADSAPKTKSYQCVGRSHDGKPNHTFGPEFATQEEAVAYRKEIMNDPETPNPTDIGIRTISKVAEGINEDVTSTDPLEGALLNAIQELVSQGHKDVDPMVLTNMVVAATSRPFLLKDLVDANNNSLAVQHYIDSISPSKVKFSTDTLTVKNEDPSKDKAKARAGVSSMASRAANRNRLGENTINGPHGMLNVEKKNGVTTVTRQGWDSSSDHRALATGGKYFPNKDMHGQSGGNSVKTGSGVDYAAGTSRKIPHQDLDYTERDLDETKGLHTKVKIVKGSDAGKTGWVRLIKTDKLRNRVYLDIDLEDGGQSVVLKQDVRLVKDVTEAVSPGVDTVASIKKLWQYIGRNLDHLASMSAYYEENYQKPYVEDRLNTLLTTADGQPITIGFDDGGKIEVENGVLYIPVGTMWRFRGMFTGQQFVQQVSAALGGSTIKEAQDSRRFANPAEKEVPTNDKSTTNKMFNYTGSNAKVKNLVRTSKNTNPHTSNDTEAALAHMADMEVRQNDALASAQEVNDQQEKAISSLNKAVNQSQKNYSAQEKRFQDLTARIRSQGGVATARQVQQANMAADIEKQNQAQHATSQAQHDISTTRAAKHHPMEGIETPLRDKEDYIAKRAELQRIQLDPDSAKDPALTAELARRLHSLNQQYSMLREQITKFRESRGHKVIATKLDNIDRMNNVKVPSPAERREQLRIAKAKEEAGKQQVKEFAAPGANPAPVVAPANDPAAKQQAQTIATATNTIKSATGSTVAAPVLATALDAASQGQANPAQVKAIAPIANVVDAATKDPKLAGQFKTLATQAQQSLKAQQKPQ